MPFEFLIWSAKNESTSSRVGIKYMPPGHAHRRHTRNRSSILVPDIQAASVLFANNARLTSVRSQYRCVRVCWVLIGEHVLFLSDNMGTKRIADMTPLSTPSSESVLSCVLLVVGISFVKPKSVPASCPARYSVQQTPIQQARAPPAATTAHEPLHAIDPRYQQHHLRALSSHTLLAHPLGHLLQRRKQVECSPGRDPALGWRCGCGFLQP